MSIRECDWRQMLHKELSEPLPPRVSIRLVVACSMPLALPGMRRASRKMWMGMELNLFIGSGIAIILAEIGAGEA